MIIKVKVSDVAKDFGKNNKDIIGILSNYCEGKKTANTVLEENELNILFDKLTQDNSVASFDEYFGSVKKAEKPQAKKAAPKKEVKKEVKMEIGMFANYLRFPMENDGMSFFLDVFILISSTVFSLSKKY